MKLLVFGKGYVGTKFVDYFGNLEGYEVRVSDTRVSDYSDLRAELEAAQPDVVVNCIGKTGRPNVDWCEDHKVETLFGNVEVPLMMARACQELGLYLVHVGSGCVYEGYKNGEGFAEDDEPNFEGSFYSRTKAWSEAMLEEMNAPESPILQLRLRMPLDGEPGPRNFITKITKYPRVINVPNSISVLDDFLAAAKALIDQRAAGIYNVTNPGVIDHKTILDMYKEIVDPEYEYELMSMEELAALTKAGRSNCGLSTRKLEEAGVHLPSVEEAVRATLRAYKQQLHA